MFELQNLTLFVLSGLLLNMAPGPDSLFIMTRSARQGWRAGSVAAFGIAAGVFVHILAAAFGLSAVLVASATAFSAVKLLGAVYLLYLGLTLLRGKSGSEAASSEPKGFLSYRKTFLQGFMTNVLNPKVALFFLAFVPQFIPAETAHKTLAFLFFGSVFNVNSLLWSHVLVLSTSLASERLKRYAGLTRWVNRTVGGLFIALGIRLALARHH